MGRMKCGRGLCVGREGLVTNVEKEEHRDLDEGLNLVFLKIKREQSLVGNNRLASLMRGGGIGSVVCCIL